jgi:DNA-binding NarL/FixJ family response regulator
MPIRVILADDSKLIRELLINHLAGSDDIIVVGQAENGQDVIRMAAELDPEVILMDIDMPVLDGVQATSKLSESSPEIKIIALTMHSKENIIKKMLEAGATGYLSKNCDSDELLRAIRTVRSGSRYLSDEITDIVIKDYLGKTEASVSNTIELSDRELEIMKLIVDGIPVSSIAERLFVSVKTVNTHRQNILEKLNLKSTADLVKYAIKKGIISLDHPS